MTKDELFEKFIEYFPKFKSNVKNYYLRDEGLKIYTKQGGKFIFNYHPETNEFTLTSA